MQQFIETNWLSLLSILIGIVVAYVFFRLQRKDSASASQERKKNATNELLDVVESYIINKQRLSEHVIDNLIFASERDHAVVLRPSCTAISLLQDVALRLQRSRHLDIPQKSEYSEKIEELIREIRDRSEHAPLQHLNQQITQKLAEVEALVPAEKREEARRQLSALATLSERQRDLSLKRDESSWTWMATTTAMMGLMTAVATSIVGSKVFDMFSSVAQPLERKIDPIAAVLVFVVVLFELVALVVRIQRRSNEGGEHGPRKEG
jgi:MFS superfamily sulfate permease-like transporter